MSLLLGTCLDAATRIVATRQQLEPVSTQPHLTARERVNDAHAAAVTARLEAACLALARTLGALDDAHDRLRAIGAQAEALVVDCSRARGMDAAFVTPVWTTWPLARFVEAIHTLEPAYLASLHLARALFATLTDHATALAQCQAALAQWACAPLLPSREAIDGELAFEEACAVEVPAPV